MIRKLLDEPVVYIVAQKALGADRIRRIAIEQHLRPVRGEKILDIGCGPGQCVSLLPQVDYFGFDVAPRYIAYANRKYGDRGRFFCQHFDQSLADLHGPFDAVLLLGVLHHLDDEEFDSLFGVLAGALTPQGRVVTVDPCRVPGQNRLSRWVADHDRGKFIRSEAGYDRIMSLHFADRSARTLVNPTRIPSVERLVVLRHPLQHPSP